MRPRIFLAILLLLVNQMTVWTSNPMVYEADTIIDTDDANVLLLNGTPIVVTGNSAINISQLYQPELIIENRTTTDSKLVTSGLWLQTEQNATIEHQILVYDTSFTEKDQESVDIWLNELSPLTPPVGYRIMGIITQIDHHEPYGVLKTRIEVLKLVEENNEYDWYDVTVTQRLTPGANYTSSNWEWNWLQYTMNGSLGSSNIYLSDYDAPNREELPQGPFGFLWRLLGFDLRKYIPWLFPPEPIVTGVDMSDFSIELFRARYEAQRNYRYRNEPLEERHHYVLRIEDGKSPVFWHQTQVQYTQADDFAQIPYITPPLASGYITINR